MIRFKKLLTKIGPGFITGAADDDPSGIATYSQTGAQFGFSQNWTALFAFPFMTVIQEMCGRIGLVTGKGLAGVLSQYYPRPFLFSMVILLYIANVINIGADLGAMASSLQLLVHIPFFVWLLAVTFISIFLQIRVPYPYYSKVLRYLALSLLVYVITVFVIHPNWKAVFVGTLFPHITLTKAYILNLVAILGTTISPYLFFWQADEEVEEEIEDHKLRTMGRGIPHINIRRIKNMRLDTIIGMLFSDIITFFIFVATASTLHIHGITSVNTADQAATALKPFAGNFAFIIFALGIIGTGLLAVPVLAGSASYALAESFKVHEGLYRRFKDARFFYIMIGVATIVGMFVNFLPIKPFQLLYYTAAINGVVAPPLMIMLLLITNNKNIMGKYTNSLFSNIIGWIITLFMGGAAIGLVVSLF